jgi:predicted CDP-diglyceride synthetase/phosphatidate cytidylyltransferase
MGLGGCIILIAVGAILTFATDWHMEGVNLDLVGVILMIVGLIGVTTFSSVARRRRVVVPPSTPVIEEERHHYRDGYGG